MWVLGVGAGCLDRDLFQYERQRAMVRGLLLLVLAVVGVAVLVLTAHDLIAGAVHQNWHSFSLLYQQPQQAYQMKDKVWKQILMANSRNEFIHLQISDNVYNDNTNSREIVHNLCASANL